LTTKCRAQLSYLYKILQYQKNHCKKIDRNVSITKTKRKQHLKLKYSKNNRNIKQQYRHQPKNITAKIATEIMQHQQQQQQQQSNPFLSRQSKVSSHENNNSIKLESQIC